MVVVDSKTSLSDIKMIKNYFKKQFFVMSNQEDKSKNNFEISSYPTQNGKKSTKQLKTNAGKDAGERERS